MNTIFNQPYGFCFKMSQKKRNIPSYQWEFQDPKIEVLCHIRPYFAGIFPYIGLIYGRYLQFRFLKWPLIIFQKTIMSFELVNPTCSESHPHDSWLKANFSPCPPVN
jgi:hypothetical protein